MRHTRFTLLAALAPLALLRALAQPVDPPPSVTAPVPGSRPVPPGPDTPRREPVPGPANTTSVFEGAAPAFRPPTFLDNPFQVGPFQFRPHADYIFTYGNGVSTSPGTQHTTAHHRLSPGLLVQGAHITIDYTPSLNYYSEEAFDDTVDHSAFLAALYSAGDWDFRLRQVFSKSSSPLIETGTQTESKLYTTSVGGSYRYSDRISFDLGLDQRIQSVEQFNSSSQWSTTDWINYHFSDRSTFGLGAVLGYVDVSDGSDMAFEQVQARVTSAVSDKLRAEIGGGVEFRQFLDIADASTRLNPLMNARITYLPWENTMLSLSANRTVDTSLFENLVTESSHIQMLLQQRLFGRLTLNVSGGYRMSEQEGGNVPDQTGRSDDLTTVSVSLRAHILTRVTASAFYRYNTNDSTSDLYSFDSEQFGIQVGYRF